MIPKGKERSIGVTFKHHSPMTQDDHYYRGLFNPTGPVCRQASRVQGPLEVGIHRTTTELLKWLADGTVKEIPADQALRLQQEANSTPVHPRRKKAGRTKLKLWQVWIEPETLAGVKELAKRRKSPVNRVVREWIRLGLALAQDKEKS